jgi:hypothetical protein
MITNGDLIKQLQRFPVEGVVKLRRYDSRGHSSTELLDVDRVEMAIDAAPMPLTDVGAVAPNVAWMDLVKEKIQVVLIFGSPKDPAVSA